MNRMATSLVVAVATAAFVGCAGRQLPDPPKEPIRDDLIVPKVRIGEAALGMTESQVLQWLGTPNDTIRGDGSRIWYRYDRKGLFVGVEGGRVVQVEAMTGSSYRSADGIGPGTPELKVRAAWGQPTKSVSMHELSRFDYCFANDLKVMVDTRESTVSAIAIYADGCWVAKR
ncbi:MAG: hypothetical protein ACT4P3_21755 [Betaproteobacteria bacterium]